LNVNALLALFNLFDNQKSLILCRVFRDGQVVRNPKSKWFLSKQEYAESNLGTYCQGMAFAFSGNLLPKMLQNMKRVQYLWVKNFNVTLTMFDFLQMDDWYVAHALLNATQATYVDIGRHFVSTNSREELGSLFQHNSTLRHEPLFGHFRPSDR
jgi:hypothetical protein